MDVPFFGQNLALVNQSIGWDKWLTNWPTDVIKFDRSKTIAPIHVRLSLFRLAASLNVPLLTADVPCLQLRYIFAWSLSRCEMTRDERSVCYHIAPAIGLFHLMWWVTVQIFNSINYVTLILPIFCEGHLLFMTACSSFGENVKPL